MAVDFHTDITVIIATRNRAESLRQTLSCLATADKGGLRCEVVIIDNGSTDHTCEVVRAACSPELPVRCLAEPKLGKGQALNRALDADPLGDVVVVLDDDMSPHTDWFTGIKAICDRWPKMDFFTGKSYVIWPAEHYIPAWCLHPGLQLWAFSVYAPETDRAVTSGRWFSGNFFWFRSRVLTNGRRFETGENCRDPHFVSDPQFMLNLAEDGFHGLMAPDAVCGHRIQPDLLMPSMLRLRAERCGRAFAEVRLRPYRSSVKQALLFNKHPIFARCYCVWRMLKWTMIQFTAKFSSESGMRIAWELQSTMEVAYYLELLRITSRMPEYSGIIRLRK